MRLTQVVFCAMIVLASGAAQAISCQELAKKYAEGEASMSEIELTILRNCVHDALRKRFDPSYPPPSVQKPPAPAVPGLPEAEPPLKKPNA